MTDVEAWVADLLADAEFSENQAVDGPLFPERGITSESLLAYAADCRRKAERPNATLLEALGSGIAPELVSHLILNLEP